ncbi:response regulator [Archangium sp.]|uniref:response regulator n=1 Tax=Archangium sp. TaxID=1872627 RepID=UPI002869FD85|nr:response regulator [Archangium sp.]
MKSILLIDDDPDLVEIYTEILEQPGHVVASAPNGRAGLELARKREPDLIITDVSMPVMDGLELCRQLREDERLCAVPRIIHSSEVNPRIPRGEVFLPKPCEPWAFMALVNRLLSDEAGASPCARRPSGRPSSRRCNESYARRGPKRCSAAGEVSHLATDRVRT